MTPLLLALITACQSPAPPPTGRCGAFSPGEGWREQTAVRARDRLLLEREDGAASAEARCIDPPPGAREAKMELLHQVQLLRQIEPPPPECALILFGRAAGSAAVLEVLEGCPEGTQRLRAWISQGGRIVELQGHSRAAEAEPRALWEPLLTRFPSDQR